MRDYIVHSLSSHCIACPYSERRGGGAEAAVEIGSVGQVVGAILGCVAGRLQRIYRSYRTRESFKQIHCIFMRDLCPIRSQDINNSAVPQLLLVCNIRWRRSFGGYLAISSLLSGPNNQKSGRSCFGCTLTCLFLAIYYRNAHDMFYDFDLIFSFLYTLSKSD